MSSNHEKLSDISLCNLRADCSRCFGLCCVVFYFSASEGFPANKEPGKPCDDLQPDFRCGVHEGLRNKGYKGCMAYDCFGAGQKVAQVSFCRNDWLQVPESANQMFEVFLIMQQLHEMLWYLTEALTYEPAHPIHRELKSMLLETERLTLLSPGHLLQLDVEQHRDRVNTLLLKTSELVRNEVCCGQKDQGRQKTFGRGADLIGADLRKADLRGANFRGAYLIAADLRGNDLSGTDLIGADFRDTNIKGADLSRSMFLTQTQINAAKGDENTKLPPTIDRPAHWD